jgi:hypothetical protein
MAAVCPHCGQPIAHERLGVVLTPLKAAIVDRIKWAGDLGRSSESLVRELYLDRFTVSRTTLKAHVWQINELLAGTDYCIVSERRRWFLRRVSQSIKDAVDGR